MKASPAHIVEHSQSIMRKQARNKPASTQENKSFLVEGIVKFAESVADAFIDFLFAPHLRTPPSPPLSVCSVAPPPPDEQSSPERASEPPQSPEQSSTGNSLAHKGPACPNKRLPFLSLFTSHDSKSDGGSRQEIEAQRDKVELLQLEVDHVRDTMAQCMVILGKPSDDDVDRPEFLGELWKALNKRDQRLAHTIVVARTLQKEVHGLQERNLDLMKRNRVLHEKIKFNEITYPKFLDSPDSRFRKVLNELAEVKVHRESLIRQNYGLLEKNKEQQLITLRLVQSAREEWRRARRR